MQCVSKLQAARPSHPLHLSTGRKLIQTASLRQPLGSRAAVATHAAPVGFFSSPWLPSEPEWCYQTTHKYQQLVLQLRTALQSEDAAPNATKLSQQLTCIVAEVPGCLAPATMVEHAEVLELMCTQDLSLYIRVGQPMMDALLTAVVTTSALEGFTVPQLSQLLKSMSNLVQNKASLGRLYMTIMRQLRSVRPQSVKETDGLRRAVLAAVTAGVMQTLPPKEWCNLLWELACLGGHASNLPEVWQQGVAAVTEATRSQPHLLSHNHVFTAIQACRRSGHTAGVDGLQEALCAALEAGTINESYFL